jgi:phospholipid/cholesterol/gamma-HCH transport system ATP-binding protein
METKGQPVIEVRDLECRYGGRLILQNVNFSVFRGELFFVAGASGSGKSTLLRHLIGLERPARGSIWYFGRNFTECDWSERRELLKGFGVLFQNDALWTSMTIRENVALPLEEHAHLTRFERQEIVALKLAQVGLSGQEDRFPAELSGGMRKRAALARALALDPAVVLCDEPTSGLDPVLAQRMDALIAGIRETLGTSMVMASQSVSSILGIGDRLIFLDADAKGIIAEGTPADLARTSLDQRVQQFFHARTGEPKPRRQ